MEMKMDSKQPDVKKIIDYIYEQSIFGGFADIIIRKDLPTNTITMYMSICICGGKGYYNYNERIIDYSYNIGDLDFVLDNMVILNSLIDKFDCEILRAASKASKIMRSSVKLDRVEFKLPKKEE